MAGLEYSHWTKKEVRLEHIGKVLGNFRREADTPNLKITEPSELTLEEKLKELRQNLAISSLDNTFQNFKPVTGTGKALAAFKALASGRTDWKMLLCYGGVGSGKTHLCEATVIALYKRGLFSRLLTMAEIMRALKGTMNNDAHTTLNELLDRYSYADWLIIDDVGMGGSGSEWEWGQLEEIITVRYRECLFTVMTTNRDISELPERIVSRFRDSDVGRVVLNQGEDYRALKGGKREL